MGERHEPKERQCQRCGYRDILTAKQLRLHYNRCIYNKIDIPKPAPAEAPEVEAKKTAIV
jgi:ribosomal protein S27AE